MFNIKICAHRHCFVVNWSIVLRQLMQLQKLFNWWTVAYKSCLNWLGHGHYSEKEHYHMISAFHNPAIWMKIKAQETKSLWKTRWNAMCHDKYLKTPLWNDYWWNNKIRARIHHTKSVLSSHGKVSYRHNVKLELWLIWGVGYRFKQWWNKRMTKNIQKLIKILVFSWENILKTSEASRMGK